MGQFLTLRRVLLAGGFALVFLGVPSVAHADDPNLTVSARRYGDRVVIVARMTGISDAMIDVSAQLQNMAASRPLPATFQVSGIGDHTLVTLQATTPALHWSYNWKQEWRAGHRLAAKPQPFLYHLPYHGDRYRVIQGPYGHFSHYLGSESEESIDFAMPVGTTICAARGGAVVGIRTDCTRGGVAPRYIPDCNYIIIRHSDGTYARYLHLEQDGSFVHMGEKVQTGEPIGRSGQTGYTSAPHLHFEVFYAASGHRRVDLPIVFAGPGGQPFKPEQGRVY